MSILVILEEHTLSNIVGGGRRRRRRRRARRIKNITMNTTVTQTECCPEHNVDNDYQSTSNLGNGSTFIGASVVTINDQDGQNTVVIGADAVYAGLAMLGS